jgi:hypothetical protein
MPPKGFRKIVAENRPGTIEKAYIRHQNKYALIGQPPKLSFEQFKEDYNYKTQLQQIKAQVKARGGDPNAVHTERLALAKKIQEQSQALAKEAERQQEKARIVGDIIKRKQEKVAKLQGFLQTTDDPERIALIKSKIAEYSK